MPREILTLLRPEPVLYAEERGGRESQDWRYRLDEGHPIHRDSGITLSKESIIDWPSCGLVCYFNVDHGFMYRLGGQRIDVCSHI